MKTPGLRAAWNQQRKQQLLRKEYGIADNKTIVVERKNVLTNTLRLLLQTLGYVMRFAATLTIAMLAFCRLGRADLPRHPCEFVKQFPGGLKSTGTVHSLPLIAGGDNMSYYDKLREDTVTSSLRPDIQLSLTDMQYERLLRKSYEIGLNAPGKLLADFVADLTGCHFHGSDEVIWPTTGFAAPICFNFKPLIFGYSWPKHILCQ